MADAFGKKLHEQMVKRAAARMFYYTPDELSGSMLEPSPPDSMTDTGVREYYRGGDDYPEGAMATTHMREMPIINYYGGSEHYPDVQEHERIHAGQLQLKNPSADQIKTIFGRLSSRSGDPVYETPAYELANSGTIGDIFGRVPKFAAYLALMRNLNKDNTYKLEANMPEDLMKNYITTTPYPYPAVQNTPKEMSMGDMIKWAMERRKK